MGHHLIFPSAWRMRAMMFGISLCSKIDCTPTLPWCHTQWCYLALHVRSGITAASGARSKSTSSHISRIPAFFDPTDNGGKVRINTCIVVSSKCLLLSDGSLAWVSLTWHLLPLCKVSDFTIYWFEGRRDSSDQAMRHKREKCRRHSRGGCRWIVYGHYASVSGHRLRDYWRIGSSWRTHIYPQIWKGGRIWLLCMLCFFWINFMPFKDNFVDDVHSVTH